MDDELVKVLALVAFAIATQFNLLELTLETESMKSKINFLNRCFLVLPVAVSIVILSAISALLIGMSPGYAQSDSALQTAEECKILQTSLQTLVKASDFKNADRMVEVLNISVQDLEKAKLSNPVLQSVRSGYVKAIANLAQVVKAIGAEHPDHQPLKSQFFKPSFTEFSKEISPWIQKAVTECPNK
ncbi:hypothetical protein TUMEXPCC7403_22460 [Tumidithrix helvetica PCC 7403]|uniref:hypothetical protein n=1 Tax=Tumidithrix helvetica TaxID=3457545 RepID=UPI003C99FC4C